MDRADTHHQHPAPDEVGRLLAETREAFGLSVADVAAQLRLSPRQIEALESEEYDLLPGKTFTRGFVRNYARLLQMNPEPLLAALEHALPQNRASDILPKTENIPFSTGKEDGWRRYLLLLSLLVLVIPLVLYQAYRDSRAPTPQPTAPLAARPAATPESDPAPTASPVPAPSPAAEAPGAAPAPPAPPTTAVPSAATEPSVEKAPPVAASSQPPPAEKRPAGNVESPAKPTAAVSTSPPAAPGVAALRFRFSEESWVEIRDASGQVVASQLNRPGTEWAVQVKPPVALVVGNAAGVALERNGEAVPLNPRAGSGVARLNLE